MIRKLIFILIGLALILTGMYFLGPHPAHPVYKTELPSLPSHDLFALQQYIYGHENNDQPIKPGNEAMIVWATDSVHTKTPYAIVYLHGFSASHEEGNPIHREIAKKYGMNLYLSRLAGHGKSVQEPLLNFTAEKAWNDAKEAYTVGKELGNQVILMSTSTGGTLSLKLCAEYPEIAAQILMSPNIAIKDPNSWLLNNPWGLQIARVVIGSDYRTVSDTTALYAQYWNNKYRIESLTQLEELIETTMTPTVFSKVRQPTLMLYYYKDDKNQDPVVRVDAMLKMYDQLGTPADSKHKKAVPNAGDHVLGSSIKSHDLPGVKLEIENFIEETFGIKPKVL